MTIQRAGLYERVSTDEQALRGFSIETQIDNLTEYCEKNKLKIVDHYTDEGISGAKPPLKRPALQRLLDDVEAGKIDIILFTKLDRWFRSVKEYYKVQDILDKCGVQWRAIHENYDTTTANGQMAITIFLAVAQNERDRTAERIKVVFEHKRKNGEACFGGPYKPFGYMKEKDENGVSRLVFDPEEKDACAEFWRILVNDNNLNKAIRCMQDDFGIVKDSQSWTRISRNPFYCGMYEGNTDYCPQYVSPEAWLRIQDLAKRRRQDTRAKRVYLFSGLIRCPECGHVLCGTYSKQRNGKEYLVYRCRFKFTTCTYRHTPTEKKIEKYLLANLERYMRDEIARAELEQSKPKPKPKRKNNLAALKERLRRLEVVYMAGNKPDSEYLKEQAEIKALIAKAQSEEPPAPRNLAPIKEFLKTDFRAIYDDFDDVERQRFWRGIIKEIKLDGKEIVDVDFR